MVPTKDIYIENNEFLSWHNFKEVYAIDRFHIPYKKKQMLEKLLINENIKSNETLYIGDRYSDYIASKKNKISFIGADWGGE